MFRRLVELFGKKLQKMPHFAKKPENSSTWPKLDTFSRKLPCLVVWVNFSAKSCKKCLISRKSMKNGRFGQNLTPFRADYHLSAFGSTFRQKAANTASFREKAFKIVGFAKTCNFFDETIMFLRLGQLFSKRLKACLISRKSVKNCPFG